VCFVDTSSLEPAHKIVTALLPFSGKTSDANYTNLTMSESVKMEEVSSASLCDRQDVPSASQTPSSMLQRTNLKISSEQSVAENEQD
jgi:hypothetical protein